MDAINKTLAGQGAISPPDCMPLDEYVQSAWASAGIDVDTDAIPGDRIAAPELAHSAFPSAMPDKEPPQHPMRAQLRRDALAPAAESITEQITSPRSLRPKDKRQDNAPVIGFAPPTAVPAVQADLSWLPQRGVAASMPTEAPKGLKAAATLPVSPVRVSQVRAQAAAFSAQALPTALKVTRSTPKISPATVSKIALPATPKTISTAVAGAVSLPAGRSAAPTVDVAKPGPGPVAYAQLLSLPAGAPDAPTVIPTATPAAISSVAMRQKEKLSPLMAESPSTLPLAPIQQASTQSVVPQDGKSQQPHPSKPQMPAAATAAAKADSAASGGASLTYRFDKWNGNHAVTVQTTTPADMPQAAARGDLSAAAATATATGSPPDFPAAPQLPLPSAAQYNQFTQYTLSPSDQLVGQRLGEHLAQFGQAVDMPSLHLKDAYEQQQQQRQRQEAPQEDDEEEA